jgi:1-acyl-sn-glycerol-3-phosphate acyltransferase
MFHVCCTFYLFIIGMHSSRKTIEYDYSEYLGKDYLKTQKLPKRVSTIISNHITWLDPVVFIK